MVTLKTQQNLEPIDDMWLKVKDKGRFKKTELIKKLPCNHEYHTRCLKEYFMNLEDLSSECALCRQPFMLNDMYSSNVLDNFDKETKKQYYKAGKLFDLNSTIEDIITKIKTDGDRIPEIIHNEQEKQKNLNELKRQENLKKLWIQIYYWGKFIKLDKVSDSIKVPLLGTFLLDTTYTVIDSIMYGSNWKKDPTRSSFMFFILTGHYLAYKYGN